MTDGDASASTAVAVRDALWALHANGAATSLPKTSDETSVRAPAVRKAGTAGLGISSTGAAGTSLSMPYGNASMAAVAATSVTEVEALRMAGVPALSTSCGAGGGTVGDLPPPPGSQCIRLARYGRSGRAQVRERYIGQQRSRCHRQQMGRGIEYLLALAAAHPSFRDAQLVRHNLEGGGAGRAAGDLAHQRAIVEAMPRLPEQRSRTFSGARSSRSSRLRHPPLPAAARARRPP